MISKVSVHDIMSYNLGESGNLFQRRFWRLQLRHGIWLFFWPNAPLYVQLPTLLPNGRELQSLGSIQGTWPFPHLPSHLLSERGRTLYKPGLKCNIQWLLGAIVLSPGGETDIEMTRWASLACCTGCPSLPGSHTFLKFILTLDEVCAFRI